MRTTGSTRTSTEEEVPVRLNRHLLEESTVVADASPLLFKISGDSLGCRLIRVGSGRVTAPPILETSRAMRIRADAPHVNRGLYRLAAWVFLTILGLLGGEASGWDSAVEEALKATERQRGGVVRDRVRPRWVGDGSRFWYSVDLLDGDQEFVLVDATTGETTRGDSFANLGLEPDPPLFTSELSRRLKRTQRTGAAVRLEFTNRTDRPVKLFWVDPENRRRAYGTLPVAGQRVQNTYEGHVWMVADRRDRVIAVLEADASRRSVVIDAPGKSAPSDPEGGQSRGGRIRSPDGRWSAEIRDHNLTLRHEPDGREVQLTEDGVPAHRYRGPIRWSPDSSALTLARVREPERRRITLVESSPRGQLQPSVREIDYAKPGDEMPEVIPVLFRVPDDAANVPERVSISNAMFETPFNEAGRLDVDWAQNGDEFYFDYNRRGHQLYRVVAVDANSGETRVVVEERSETFIDYRGKTWRHWLTGGERLLWMSERDGWNHLWLYDVKKGVPIRQLTRGRWVVRDVLRVDERQQQVWFMASGIRPEEDPYHLHLCRVDLDGSDFRQLTEADGTHEIRWSPDRRWFIATWSRADHPPVTEFRRSDDGSLVATLERADASRLLSEGWSMPERFTAVGRDGETEIHGIIIRPQPFDPGKTYPVVEEVYAGPHGAFTPKSFGTLSRQQAFARAGFVVVQADGMGTNHRGRAFHSVAWKNLQDAGFPDRIAWIRAAGKDRPWMDLSRVGVYGGSAGGQSAVRALIDHHEFYDAAVADCGCHDNRLDKRWWNEQWLGWPIDESYLAASNVEDAERLQGSLLLVVGELDRNVDPASTLQVVDRLIRADKPFEFLLIPGVGHGAAETPYGVRRRLDFFRRHLGGGNDRESVDAGS